jgi:hypothetical protein
MATHTNVPSWVLQSKVVPFHSPQAITQTELVLFLSLRGRLQQLQEQIEADEHDFKVRLEADAAIVQPGDHAARLDEHSWEE